MLDESCASFYVQEILLRHRELSNRIRLNFVQVNNVNNGNATPEPGKSEASDSRKSEASESGNSEASGSGKSEALNAIIIFVMTSLAILILLIKYTSPHRPTCMIALYTQELVNIS